MWTLIIASALGQNHPVEGTFVVADGKALSAAHDRAVDAAAAAFPWALRALARPRIRAHVWNCGTLGLRLVPDAVEIRCDSHPPIIFSAGASGTRWTDAEGQEFEVHLSLSPDMWELTFDGDSGSLIWRYNITGDHLMVDTEIRSPLLSRSIGWVAAYARQGR